MATTKRRKRTLAEAIRERVDEDNKYKLSLLRELVAKHGWQAVQRSRQRAPIRYRGIDLGQWVISRRAAYRNGTISDELVQGLEAIPGWTWTPVRDRQRAIIDNLRSFVRRHGWDALHVDTKIDGVLLADWCKQRRAEYRRGVLPKWIATSLAAIPGWSWEPFADSHIEWLRTLREYVARHGWSELRLHTLSRDGKKLGRWVNAVRHLRRGGRLPEWVAGELETIRGWTWEPAADRRAKRLQLVRRYVANHGWDALNCGTVVERVKIGQWVHDCKKHHRLGALSAELARELETIPGWSWHYVGRGPRRAASRRPAARTKATQRAR